MAETKIKGIGERIAAVMADVTHVEKTGENAAQHYKYVEISEVVRAVRDSMVKHGIILEPRHEIASTAEVQTRNGGTMQIVVTNSTFKFRCADDLTSYIETTTVGCGSDSGDKAPFKAMTGALKYALTQTFCLPAGDDAEVDSHERAPKAPASRPAPIARPQQAARPKQPEPQDGWVLVQVERAFRPTERISKRTNKPFTVYDMVAAGGEKFTTMDHEIGAQFQDGACLEVVADEADNWGKRKVLYCRPSSMIADPAGDPLDDVEAF